MASKINLLVVGAFAGTYAVARQLPTINEDTEITGISIGAYAGIEYQERLHLEAERLTAVRKSLGKDNYLNICGDITDQVTQAAVLGFVSSRLEKSNATAASVPAAFDAVLVFGGPPCEAYSRNELRRMAVVINEQAKAKKQVKAARTLRSTAVTADSALGLTGPALAAAKETLQRAESHLLVSEQQYQAANARLEKQQQANAKRRDYADKVVQSFIELYHTIKQACKQCAKPPACYLVMENVESVADLALWNRPFLKPQLICLPPIPSAVALNHQPGPEAWLYCVKQNLCRYGQYQFPMKPTVLFTNLPALQTTRCICQKKHAVTTDGLNKGNGQENATERAEWPPAFVLRTIWLCAEHVRLHNPAEPTIDPTKKPLGRAAAEKTDVTTIIKPADTPSPHLLAAWQSLKTGLLRLKEAGRGSLTWAREVIRALHDVCGMVGGQGLLGRQPDVIAAMVDVLCHPIAEIRVQAGEVVSKLVHGHPANQAAVASNTALIDKVQEALAAGKNNNLRKAAAQIVWSLAAGNAATQELLGSNAAIIRGLVVLMKVSDDDVLCMAVAALGTLAAGCPANQQRIAQTPGALAGLRRLETGGSAQVKHEAAVAHAAIAADS